MNVRGFTLVEALVSVAIVAIVVIGILPAFMVQLAANRRSEERSGAISAAQQRMEALRQEDPGDLPDSGQSAPQSFVVDDRQYVVVTRYCQRPEYCGTSSRHIIVEVSFDDRKIYGLETVYTQLL